MSGGGLAKLRLVMEIDGDKAVVTGLERVDAAVDRASRSTAAATGRMVDSHRQVEVSSQRTSREVEGAAGRMAQSVGTVSTATGRMAAEHTRHMHAVADNYRHVHGSMTEFEQRLQSVTMRVMNFTMAAGLIAAPIALWVHYADVQTMLDSRTRLVTHSTNELTASRERLFALAQSTRTSEEATVDLYARISRSTKELGRSQEDLFRITETVNKSIGISGGSAASAQAALVQLGQAFASGTLRGEELNSVMEQAPRLAEAIATGMGVSIGKLRKMGEEGELTAQAIVEALLSQSAAIDAEYSKITLTVSQAFTVLDNSVGRYIGGVDQASSASARFASVIVSASDHVGDIADAVVAVAVVIGGRFVLALGAAATASAVKTATMVSEWFAVRAAAASATTQVGLFGEKIVVATAAGRVSGLATALGLVGGPIGLITTALGLGATAWYLWGRNAEDAADRAKKALKDLPAHIPRVDTSIPTTGGHGTFKPRTDQAAASRWQQTLANQTPSTPTPARKPEEDEDAIKRLNEYTQAYNQLQDARRAGNPYLTEEARELTQLNIRYENLIAKFPEYRAELLRNLELDKQQLAVTRQLAEARAMAKREIDDLQAGADATKSFENSLALDAVQVWRENRTALERFNDEYDRLLDLKNRFPATIGEATFARAVTAARRELDDLVTQAQAEIDRIHAETIDIKNSMIEDPFEQRQAQIEAAYNREKKAIEDKIALLTRANEAEVTQITARQQLVEEGIRREFQLRGGKEWVEFQKREKDLDNKKWHDLVTNAKKGTAQINALNALLVALKEKRDYDLQKNEEQAFTAKISMLGNYAGIAAQLFDAMAQSQDQSSREGFESAKDYAMGAALMSTAAAVIGQLTGPDAWTPAAWARAVAAGVLGAAQVAAIASTSYGGGAVSVSAPAGSFSVPGQAGGGRVGGSIGGPDQAIRDTVTEESLRTAALSMQDASLAMTRVADGLTKISDAMADGSLVAMAIGQAPGRGLSIPDNGEGIVKKLLKLDPMHNLTFGTNPVDFFKGVGNVLFGWGNKWQPTGSGIELGMGSGELIGREYTEWKKKGGWFRKDKHRTDYSDLDQGFAAAIDSVLDQVKASITRAAVAMGTDVDFESVNIGLARIATAGRSTEDILKDVENWLVSVSGILAMTMDGLAEFAFYGENAFDAAMRLVTALQSMNEGMELLGRGKIESTLFGANAAYKLQELMGGAEKAQEKIEAYFEAMFTEPQQDALRLEQYTRQIAVAFKEMGAGIPETREMFQLYVKSQDLTTERGRAMFAALMDIADVFAKRIELEEKLADVQREQIELLAERTSAREDLMVRYLQASGYEQTANLLGLWIDQQREYKEWAEKGYDTTELLKVQAVEWAQAMSQVSTAMRQTKISILETIISLRTGEQSILSPEAKYRELQAQFRATEDPEKLKALATQYLSASRGFNASGAGYVADFNEVMSRLGGLIGMDDVATQQLSVLQLQLEQLKQLNESLSSSSEPAGFLAQLASGDVPMGALMQMLWRGGDLSSGNIGDLFESTRESAMAMAEKFRQGALAQGLSADIAQRMYDIGMRLNGFAVGSPGIPYDQVAMVHAGEKIIDAQSSAILSRYGIRVQAAAADNRETVAELRALREEVKALRGEMAANTRVNQYVGGKMIESGERTAEASETTARYIRREVAA